ncbi:MAG: methyltransferase domain-containing protein [Planctomycetota bacterium]
MTLIQTLRDRYRPWSAAGTTAAGEEAPSKPSAQATAAPAVCPAEASAAEAPLPAKPVLESAGHCTTCDRNVTFVARNAWLRDHFACSNCGSIPRERALMAVIESYFPNWRELVIHESSPGNRGASLRLRQQCAGYIPSQFFPGEAPGSVVGGMRCENLEALALADESVDLHVTQDVMEHVFHPERAFREIARTLRAGGAHICTVPLVNKTRPSRRRARLLADGQIEHLEPAVYHGNPISEEGSLVTVDWGFDICRHIFDACGLFTQIVQIDDLSRGIRAEYIEVLVTLKPPALKFTL